MSGPNSDSLLPTSYIPRTPLSSEPFECGALGFVDRLRARAAKACWLGMHMHVHMHMRSMYTE